jgi:hypothetical protein
MRSDEFRRWCRRQVSPRAGMFRQLYQIDRLRLFPRARRYRTGGARKCPGANRAACVRSAGHGNFTPGEACWGEEWTLNGKILAAAAVRRCGEERDWKFSAAIHGGAGAEGATAGGLSEMTRFAQQVDRFYKFVKMKFVWLIFPTSRAYMK